MHPHLKTFLAEDRPRWLTATEVSTSSITDNNIWTREILNTALCARPWGTEGPGGVGGPPRPSPSQERKRATDCLLTHGLSNSKRRSTVLVSLAEGTSLAGKDKCLKSKNRKILIHVRTCEEQFVGSCFDDVTEQRAARCKDALSSDERGTRVASTGKKTAAGRNRRKPREIIKKARQERIMMIQETWGQLKTQQDNN